MLVPIAFAVLLAATVFAGGVRALARTGGEWLIDGSGLLIQGAIAVMVALVAPHGRLAISWPLQFLIGFVAIDYAFYWNHRLLHGAWWRWHSVHHTAPRLDVLVTSRNTLLTPLLMVYVWSTAAAIIILHDARGFLLGMSATAALDLWRHSPLRLPPHVRRIVSLALVTPHEHAWHHSRARGDVNFGANLSIWDRVHGTFASPDEAPDTLGIELAAGTMRRLIAGSR